MMESSGTIREDGIDLIPDPILTGHSNLGKYP